MKKKYVLALDLGGTHFSVAILDNSWNIYPGNFETFSLDLGMSEQEILNQTKEGLESVLNKYSEFKVEGVGAAMPRPFDYKKGWLLYGKYKFYSIKKVDFKKLFQEEFKLPSFFLNDADAFILGENSQLSRGKFHRVMGITLGTGLGAGFIINSELKQLGDGVPKDAEIYNLKFRDSILEDYISKRGIENIYKSMYFTNQSIEAKDIAQKALEGDKKAQEVFKKFGTMIGEGLASTVKEFKPDIIIFGGKISESFELFGTQIENKFKELIKFPPIVIKSKLGDATPLYGAAVIVFDKLNISYD